MNMNKNIISHLLLISFFLYTPLFSVNTIKVSGIVQNVDGKLLPDALLILKNQKKSVMTNRFGEFDFNKVFPGDTVIVSLKSYQNKKILVSTDMKVILYPRSDIQDQINSARNGATIIIPSGKHYIYPDFNIDSTVALSINYKTDITIQGDIDSEIILKWDKADILLIHESNNIILKNFKIGYYDSTKLIDNDIAVFDSAETFKSAFADARSQLGRDAIFKYKGKLFHTNNSNESTAKITPRNVFNIFKSYDIFIDSVNIYGGNNICVKTTESKNIFINNITARKGLYAFVFNKSFNTLVKKSLISDNSEINYNKASEIELKENIIKISGNYVPEFVNIKGGSIEMLDESIIPPPEPTYLLAKDFNISRTEVTFRQFDAFCNATNRDMPDDSEWGRGDRPVINIRYDDAIAYCSWLSNLLGKTVRLPSVDEWEYASRGGIKGGDNKLYSGSNRLQEVSWCKYNSKDQTHPVGLKLANELGLYDMSGNVYEFCEGVIDSMITLKGGSWANSGVGCRLSDQVVSKVNFWDDNIGFRCVQE